MVIFWITKKRKAEQIKEYKKVLLQNKINSKKVPLTKCSECHNDSDTWICDKCRAI